MRPIHVAIGSEPDQRIPALVLEHTIRARASRPVEIHWSWDPHTLEWNPLAAQTPRIAGTNFSSWRWLAPRVVHGWSAFRYEPHPGRAIYLDCDQVVLADLVELESALPLGPEIMACVVGAVGNFGGKEPEPNAFETSVMVFRVEAPWDYDFLSKLVFDERMLHWVRKNVPEARQAKSDYAALMQATWIQRERVKALDPAWNHMNYYDPKTTLLVHFTHVRSQPWKAPGHALSKFWAEHLREAIAAGAVSVADVEEAVKSDHVDAFWLAVAREPDGV